MHPDDKVLSYGDVLIRRSDVELLTGPHWLNDQVPSAVPSDETFMPHAASPWRSLPTLTVPMQPVMQCRSSASISSSCRARAALGTMCCCCPGRRHFCSFTAVSQMVIRISRVLSARLHLILSLHHRVTNSHCLRDCRSGGCTAAGRSVAGMVLGKCAPHWADVLQAVRGVTLQCGPNRLTCNTQSK